MAKLPIITLLESVDTMTYGGQSIFELHQTIIHQFKSEPSARHLGVFFASPAVNKGRGEVHWYTNFTGQPIPFSQLESTLQARAKQMLKDNHEKLEELASRLELASSGNRIICAALRQMMTTPDLAKSLFLVGTEWVLAQWGCFFYGANSFDFTLEEQIRKTFTQKQIEKIDVPETTLPSPSLPASKPQETPADLDPLVNETNPGEFANVPDGSTINSAAQVDQDGAAIAEPTTVIQKPHRQWRWLILLILLLLLLLGLLLRGCKEMLPNTSLQEAPLRQEIAILWDKVEQKVNGCLPSSTSPGLAPITPQPAEVADMDQRLSNNSVARGKLNIALAWQGRSDLDILVEDPAGDVICIFNSCVTTSKSGGKLDIDANQCMRMSGCTDTVSKPIENISWDQKPPAGRYRISVVLFSANEEPQDLKDIPFVVEVTQESDNKIYKGIFRSSEMKCTKRCTSGKPLFVTQIGIN